MFITRPDEGNGVVIIDRNIKDKAIFEKISNTCKFEKLTEDPILKLEGSPERFLHNFKQKNIFNKNEYSILYPPGSVPTRICGTSKMQKFPSSHSFPKLRPIVSSIGTLNYNFSHFLYDRFSTLVLNDYYCKGTFSFVSQIENGNLFRQFFVLFRCK